MLLTERELGDSRNISPGGEGPLLGQTGFLNGIFPAVAPHLQERERAGEGAPTGGACRGGRDPHLPPGSVFPLPPMQPGSAGPRPYHVYLQELYYCQGCSFHGKS